MAREWGGLDFEGPGGFWNSNKFPVLEDEGPKNLEFQGAEVPEL